ncbi:thermonuclease family protein [Phyllobacterium sp. YR531]|uniref:thermonuclease family protein n=1 Tax=Phyllobacterium sp. YR531 TaxID=1144343 RepID=UPI00026FA111|nr:thermonuclease family protein [Phyllobacterium sp. YR531]EJN05364.1 micrococcal nuclease-like nuclease [Phyllobacterium sp. YR531]
MRQIPLYVLTVLVALTLAYSFIAPFQGGLETTIASNQDVSVAAEDFELPAEMQNNAPQEPEQSAPPQEEPPTTTSRLPLRQVDPDDAPAPVQVGPLERVAPRQPLSELGQATAPAPPPAAVPVDNTTAKPILLYRPVATSAGSIEASGYRISIEGINAPGPDETCNSDGTDWPCGMAARTALRNWLRSRAIECNVPDQPSDELIATQCKLGTTDVASWLVSNGWARTPEGSPLADAMKKAEERKLGLYGSAPPTLPASNELPLPPLTDTPEIIEEPASPPPVTAPDAPFPPAPQ